jgi:hypothetical protein
LRLILALIVLGVALRMALGLGYRPDEIFRWCPVTRLGGIGPGARPALADRAGRGRRSSCPKSRSTGGSAPGFTGADLLLFGAILDPAGTRAAQDYDIVVVLKGPVQSIVLREKRKVAGIWVNAASTQLRSAPASLHWPRRARCGTSSMTRPPRSMNWARSLQLADRGDRPGSSSAFAAGLVDLMQRQGLYRETAMA